MRPTLYRQGDILFAAAAEIPEGRKLRKCKTVTVAEGEMTGHHHVLELDTAEGTLLVDADAEFVRIMGANGLLVHPEHATITLPPGDYQKRRQREYTPAAVRNVQD